MENIKNTTATGNSESDVQKIINQMNGMENVPEAFWVDLYTSEMRYRRLFETAQDGILIIDALTEEITDVNPFLSEMLEYDPEHFIGKRLWEIGFFKDIQANRAAFKQLQEKGFIRYEDLPLETKDGRSIAVEFVSNSYMVDNHKIIQCNIRDITARKKAETSLLSAKTNLEIKVKKRTAKLSRANIQLRKYAAEVLRAHEDERKLVACELHDQIGQSLTSLKLMISQAERSPALERKNILSEAQKEITELVRQVREMSLNLRPGMLDDLGLLPTLLWHIERFISQTRINVTFKHSGLNRNFSQDICIAVYRIMQEALTNIARHANVKEAEVNIQADQNSIHLMVKDLGSGFSIAGLSSRTSCGLSGMRERTFLLGGSFDIESKPDKGTCLTAEIPILG